MWDFRNSTPKCFPLRVEVQNLSVLIVTQLAKTHNYLYRLGNQSERRPNEIFFLRAYLNSGCPV